MRIVSPLMLIGSTIQADVAGAVESTVKETDFEATPPASVATVTSTV